MNGFNKIIFLSLILLGACSRGEEAPSPQNYLESLRQQNATLQPQFVQAQVVSVTPLYTEAIAPQQKCGLEESQLASLEEEIEMNAGNSRNHRLGAGSPEESKGGLELVPVAVPAERSTAAPLAGALAGGVIGSQLGGGYGQFLITNIGVAAGASAADRVANGGYGKTDYVLVEVPRAITAQQRCHTTEGSQLIPDGFHVVYRYNGRNMAARLPYHPGATVAVSMDGVPH